MPDTTIKVRLIGGTWHANFGEQARELFGTDWVPTPFTSAYTFADVWGQLSRNPKNVGWEIVEDNAAEVEPSGWRYAETWHD